MNQCRLSGDKARIILTKKIKASKSWPPPPGESLWKSVLRNGRRDTQCKAFGTGLLPSARSRAANDQKYQDEERTGSRRSDSLGKRSFSED